MKFFNELFEGGTPDTQKKKRITFYAICITSIIIVALLLFLTVFGIASMFGKEKESVTPTDIGETTTIKIANSKLGLGNLLILDEDHPFKGELKNLVSLQDYPDRSKVSADSDNNTYTVYNKNTKLMATEEAAKALNNMLGDFYAEKEDDNLIVYTAYNEDKVETQNVIYASATVFELKYFLNPEEDLSLFEEIYDIEKYEWLYENAYKYGFILLGEESSLFRYVGTVHSTIMHNEELTFAKYIKELKNDTSAENPIMIEISGKWHAVYYIKKDNDHIVPKSYEYVISGDNDEGYIITVNF